MLLDVIINLQSQVLFQFLQFLPLLMRFLRLVQFFLPVFLLLPAPVLALRQILPFLLFRLIAKALHPMLW